MRTFVHTRIPRWESAPTALVLGPKRTRNRLDGKYRYLYLGKMPVEHPDSMLMFSSRGGGASFCLTPLHDPKRPKRLYHFHVLIAFDSKSNGRIAELVAIPTNEDAKGETPKKRDAAKDKFDALI